MPRALEMGTWWARKVPSTWTPSTTLGPFQPLGVLRTIIGHRGRVRSPSFARAPLDGGDLLDHLVERSGKLLMDLFRVVPGHRYTM